MYLSDQENLLEAKIYSQELEICRQVHIMHPLLVETETKTKRINNLSFHKSSYINNEVNTQSMLNFLLWHFLFLLCPTHGLIA